MAKDSAGCSGRSRLADISNMQPRPSALIQDNKSRPTSASVKQYIEHLQKENAALVQLLADRNKTIEDNAAELQKLKVTLQKLQQQNLLLVQSNSQMLAELNLVKDRQRVLQHELGCKNGLLIAKSLELELKSKRITCQEIDSKEKVSEDKGPTMCVVHSKDDERNCNPSIRQKSESLGPSAENVEGNVRDKKRLQTRRQSARFKHDEPKPTEDYSMEDDVDLPPCPLPKAKMEKDDSNSVILLVTKEDEYGDSQHRISSISRPSRKAAKKVGSYKEINLKQKMRRPE